MDDFWALLDSARADARNCCAVVSNATTLLAQRPVPEIIAAHQAVQRLMDASYLRDLWAAAYLILHGRSDDSFDYFRAYLLTQGRHVFESAVSDPDSLAHLRPAPHAVRGIGCCEDAERHQASRRRRATVLIQAMIVIGVFTFLAAAIGSTSEGMDAAWGVLLLLGLLAIRPGTTDSPDAPDHPR
ncbi:DUF4240 domain-containing protein [Lentzea terrae]|uniref:DUF4240 domain-containing protein n=1 Tax=Lentzea terrae TaxID=2200761 RepID=UPI001E471665|nr:DUF4240 domain-containing protein [Lentzea terrae]